MTCRDPREVPTTSTWTSRPTTGLTRPQTTTPPSPTAGRRHVCRGPRRPQQVVLARDGPHSARAAGLIACPACSPRCSSPTAARSRSGPSARPTSSARDGGGVPVRGPLVRAPAEGRRGLRDRRARPPGARLPRPRGDRRGRAQGAAPTRSTRATASSRRTRRSPRRAPTPASPSSARPPTCSS